jgi:hypothetical protein
MLYFVTILGCFGCIYIYIFIIFANGYGMRMDLFHSKKKGYFGVVVAFCCECFLYLYCNNMGDVE